MKNDIIGGDMGTGGAPSVGEKEASKISAVIPPKGSKPKSSVATAPEASPPIASTAAPESSFFNRNVPFVNRPLWQVALGAVGVFAVSVGLLKAVGQRR